MGNSGNMGNGFIENNKADCMLSVLLIQIY